MCRSEQLGSADKAAVRRLVTGAFQRVIATGGQSLEEVRQPSTHAIAHMIRSMHGCKSYSVNISTYAAAWSTEGVLSDSLWQCGPWAVVAVL